MRRRNGLTMRLKNVTVEALPSGNKRYRFRKTGLPSVTLPGEPGEPDFIRAYEAALRGNSLEQKVNRAHNKMKPYSMAMLIMRYKLSDEFSMLAQSTQKNYTRLLGKVLTDHGDKDVRTLKPKNVRHIRDAVERPAAANRYISLLSVLMALACEMDWIERNPCADIKRRKYIKKSHYSWTDNDIATFLDHYPSGTRERLAMLLLLDTAQRSSDVCRMGRQHLNGNTLSVRQGKTKADLTLYLDPATMHEISLHSGQMTFIVTQSGQPFTVKGFQQWFSKRCSAIGLEKCSAHGLRHARTRMILEAGATIKEAQSITGHKTDSELNRYAQAVNQSLMSKRVSQTSGVLRLPTNKIMGKSE